MTEYFLFLDWDMQVSSPGNRIPEARHSMTRRRASPAPRGLLQVAMAFSQISSRGCKSVHTRTHTYTQVNTKNKPFLLG